MRRFSFITTLLLTALFWSCGSDNKDETSLLDDMQGYWQVTSFKMEGEKINLLKPADKLVYRFDGKKISIWTSEKTEIVSFKLDEKKIRFTGIEGGLDSGTVSLVSKKKMQFKNLDIKSVPVLIEEFNFIRISKKKAKDLIALQATALKKSQPTSGDAKVVEDQTTDAQPSQEVQILPVDVESLPGLDAEVQFGPELTAPETIEDVNVLVDEIGPSKT